MPDSLQYYIEMLVVVEPSSYSHYSSIPPAQMPAAYLQVSVRLSLSANKSHQISSSKVYSVKYSSELTWNACCKCRSHQEYELPFDELRDPVSLWDPRGLACFAFQFDCSSIVVDFPEVDGPNNYYAASPASNYDPYKACHYLHCINTTMESTDSKTYLRDFYFNFSKQSNSHFTSSAQ